MRAHRSMFATAFAAGLAWGAPARADYLFSGSGTTGYLNSATNQEVWTFGFAGGLGNWGSPGIGEGVTP